MMSDILASLVIIVSRQCKTGTELHDDSPQDLCVLQSSHCRWIAALLAVDLNVLVLVSGYKGSMGFCDIGIYCLGGWLGCLCSGVFFSPCMSNGR